ncbi:MAG: DUF485 domain-containing protein [Planctomycetaceae bacterium]|nr:DUF485 domain-containing protein [Planctomycetaceae bacterium]
MAHFDNAPKAHDAGDTPVLAARRARHGMILFLIYFVLYVGFILLNVLDPKLMETTPVAGLNLAILYGFVLIAAALILALVYAWLCREPAAGWHTMPPDADPASQSEPQD